MKSSSQFLLAKASHVLVAIAFLLPLLAPPLRAAFPSELLVEQAQLPAESFAYELEGETLDVSGDTVVVGLAFDERVDVYQRESTNWVLTANLTNDLSGFTGYGEAVVIDGDTLAVGAPFARTVQVFVRSGTNWLRQAELTSADEFFGDELDLSGDTLAIGASAAGTATVFVRSGTNWVLQARLVTVNREWEEGVALDRDTLVVADRINAYGAVFVYARQGTNWSAPAHLTVDDGLITPMVRRSVAVSGDTIAVGESHGSTGRIYIYRRQGDTWLFQTKLTVTNAAAIASFGRYVSLDGDALVSGAELDNPFGNWSGSAFLFGRKGTSWVQLRRLTASDGGTDRRFGRMVALQGDTVVIVGQGAPVYVFRPDYSSDAAVASYARKFLYYPDAVGVVGFEASKAAFRYKHLLYGPAANSLVRARFEMMSSLYGTAERDVSFVAEEVVMNGLAENPDSATLGNLLLDIYHDRAVAQAIFSRDLRAKAEAARFGPTIAPNPPASGFLIDNEIPLYVQALATNRFALQEYFDVLQLELNTESGADTQFGYRLFRDLVPARALMPVSYLDTNGVPQSVLTNNTALFNGYKDLVLLFDLLRDHGRSAETLARLLISRNNPGDRDAAAMVISDAERFLFLQGTLLKQIFPSLPPEGDPSGLAEAISGWSQSLRGLGTLQQLLAGGANVLGFADDFMMYVQKFTGQTNHFDSYDAFRVRLDPNTGSNPLRSAKQAHQDALDSYASYRGFQDQLAAEFDNSSITYRDRLRDIVGVFPEDPSYSDNPTANPGSELDQQYRSIELARLRILRNQTELENLDEEVLIEINRSAAVSNAVIRYGGLQAEVTKEIGHIKAVQAGANALAQSLTVEKLTTGLFLGFLANAAVQVWAEEGIADLEANKERLAADEQAELNGIESEARVKTLLLGMRTLAVDSQEAAVLLQQELNRLVALYREKADLEQKIAEQNASTASRYFADPVHRLASQADMVEANLAFDEAQKWLYFMVRALEYKWNTPFRNFVFSLRSWSADTIFKLRNATELERMFEAMDNFESQIQLPKDDHFDWFSVRDDFFDYKRTNNLGQTLFYTDPVTGATVDAITAFRSRLSQLQDAQGNILINFSTVREIPGGTFFRGPRFDAQGQVISKGLFLDKIHWLKINLPGSHTLGRSQLTGELRYGGTAFIRNFDVGTFDPVRPDRLRNELTAYATSFWFFHAPSATWRFNEALSSPVRMQLSDDPRVPPSVQELDVFKERSVATTGWVLSIPTEDDDVPVLNLEELEDVEIYFFHYAVVRQ